MVTGSRSRMSVDHRLARAPRGAEVALGEAADPAPVLHATTAGRARRTRLSSRHHRRADDRVGADHLLDHGARDQAQHQEDQHRQPQQREGHRVQPHDDVTAQRATRIQRLVEPDAFEAVEHRRRMLPEALDRRLREVDRVRREEPEVRHVLEDHDLHAVVDLLALLRSPSCAAPPPSARRGRARSSEFQFWPLVECSARKNAVSGSA